MFSPLWRNYVVARAPRTVGGHSLYPGNGLGGRACVNGGGTLVRSRNPSAGHTRKNNGSHASFSRGLIQRRFQ
jgi:hypothetical protein